MKQEYSSKNTSINKTKLPAIYNKINWEKIATDWQENNNNKPILLDYGCGRYTNHIRNFVEKLGFEYIGYDPYWTEEINIHECKPAVVVCSNVLNVIKEDKIVKEIMCTLLGFGVPYYITVYEGNNSGIGKATSENSYQRNAALCAYMGLIGIKMKIKKRVLTLQRYTQYIK